MGASVNKCVCEREQQSAVVVLMEWLDKKSLSPSLKLFHLDQLYHPLCITPGLYISLRI